MGDERSRHRHLLALLGPRVHPIRLDGHVPAYADLSALRRAGMQLRPGDRDAPRGAAPASRAHVARRSHRGQRREAAVVARILLVACLALVACDPPGPYGDRDYNARVCVTYCRANGMTVTSWDGSGSSKHHPSGVCRCGVPR